MSITQETASQNFGSQELNFLLSLDPKNYAKKKSRNEIIICVLSFFSDES